MPKLMARYTVSPSALMLPWQLASTTARRAFFVLSESQPQRSGQRTQMHGLGAVTFHDFWSGYHNEL